ncbi:MAG: NADH-ubiquinone oxidoreductase chain D [uncultured Thermomicrobiales bacterium]|uniref:NADH-quinone oxidoreductase subunit D n=1 Tax=uncultured Thermomicrobiales bacterium TaxID=1645740 RepID=A0A6J4V3Q3_9BACT|nr:MAG: NADH-ubiquinone oxidoreductase chain D [uncultured Thermomicrobiales bacterium]
MAIAPPRGDTAANGTQVILSGDSMTINMGPQHPSTHGVLRLVLDLEGETVTRCEPVIGYLHTGFEKTYEEKTYLQGVVLTDRMDYLAPLSNNLGYALAIERLLGIEAPPRATVIRVLLAELTRINNHLVWLGTQALDLGAMSAFFYCFREREVLLDLFEMMSGARLMTSFIRPGGLMADLPDGWIERAESFLREFPGHIVEYESLLTENEIFKERTIGIGILSPEQAQALDLTGPSLRACGIPWDLRKLAPYCGYETYDFAVPTLTGGDVYDRYLIRMAEMRESTKIALQAIDRLPTGPVMTADRKIAIPPRAELATSMEALIHHFKLVSEGFKPPEGEVYTCIESPKGEIGFYLVSDGTGKPYRCHVRAPSFINLQSLPPMSVGGLVADLVAIIGSIDPVLGEVDR